MWSAITTADVLSEFTPDEAESLRTVQGATDNLPSILARAVAEVRDYIRGGGYAVDATDGTLPIGLHSDAIALARWRWLISLPKLVNIESDVRERAFKRALTKLDLIGQGNFAVEPPASEATTGNRSGNWNSENRLLMRTAPTPPASTQFPLQPTDTANGNTPAPPMPVPTQQSGVVAVPNGAQSVAVVFGNAFPAAPTTVIANLITPAGGALIECAVDGSTITAQGFTARLGIAVPNGNYQLSFFALA